MFVTVDIDITTRWWSRLSLLISMSQHNDGRVCHCWYRCHNTMMATFVTVDIDVTTRWWSRLSLLISMLQHDDGHVCHCWYRCHNTMMATFVTVNIDVTGRFDGDYHLSLGFYYVTFMYDIITLHYLLGGHCVKLEVWNNDRQLECWKVVIIIITGYL